MLPSGAESSISFLRFKLINLLFLIHYFARAQNVPATTTLFKYMNLVFDTHTPNKFKEVAQLIPPSIQLLSLKDIGCFYDIPETGKTLEENAKLKADFVTKNYGYPC